MPHFRLGVVATTALALVLPATAEAQIFGRKNAAPSTAVLNETPQCTQNLGTVTIADTQDALFRQLGVGAPTELLRVLIRESGCFTLIERGPGMDVIERERGLGAAGRIRTADFVLVAELANTIEAEGGENRPGLLGALSAAGGQMLLQAGVAALTQGQGGGMGGGLGAGMDQFINKNASAAANQVGQALSNRTVDSIKDLKKDIGRGKEDAQVVFSLASVPLAETVGYTRSVASKDDVRRLRIRDNHFGGRVGGGYESEDEGKILALAFVRGYADLVTSLGGLGSQTPEVTLANREAIRADAAAREAEENRQTENLRLERLRLEQERAAEQRRLLEQVRMEEESRRLAARPAMSSRALSRAAILRAEPDGEVIRPLSADDVVFPTGNEDGAWVEVLDSDDNLGWMQRDRLTAGQTAGY